MKFILVRKIHFHSSIAGSVFKYVSKEVESEITPQIGFDFEDPAWHRNDPIKAESISIDSESGKCTVHLNSMKVAVESDVEAFYDIAMLHGWANWLES